MGKQMNVKEKILTLGHVGMGTGTVAPFDALFNRGQQITADHIYEGVVDCLVIWGGADISPTIYNEPVGPRTGASEFLSHRDQVEVNACQAAIAMGIPIIGICRGAQLLCALAGGKLVQDVSGHCNGDHLMHTMDGRSISTSSVHHQMMYPWDIQHQLIAWSARSRSKDYIGVDPTKMVVPLKLDDGEHVEPEIVYFPTIRGLAIQGHPEFMNVRDPFVTYCKELVTEYLL
jgi:hypothetical protein